MYLIQWWVAARVMCGVGCPMTIFLLKCTTGFKSCECRPLEETLCFYSNPEVDGSCEMATNYVNAITEELTAWRSPGQTATDTASASAWVSTALTVMSFQQESVKIYFKAKVVFGELGRESVSLPVKREMC